MPLGNLKVMDVTRMQKIKDAMALNNLFPLCTVKIKQMRERIDLLDFIDCGSFWQGRKGVFHGVNQV